MPDEGSGTATEREIQVYRRGNMQEIMDGLREFSFASAVVRLLLALLVGGLLG